MSDQYKLATVEDLAGWLGESIDDGTEMVRAGWALAAATGLVLDETGQDETRWELGRVPARVQHVVLACAARAFSNPESWQYESVDDWRAGGRPVDEAGLFLTASEKRALSAFAATPTKGIGVIGTTRPVYPAVPIDPVADALLYGGGRS
ncbi:hypothetical protein [Actinomyces procaprae]|uniref:hypothetical protein n=1 Tax=Actinomyces procaprae TaxID=2560010 RepID=UPI0010A2925D|nr:hypothetical protein [Actinomyces procaprae]